MYVPPLGSCELGGFNELITSRFGRHLKNRMLGFPAQILPMMRFLSCNNSDIFQWPKLVSIGGSRSEPFSCLHIGLAFSCGPSCSIFLISKSDFHSSGISDAGNNKKKSISHSI